MKRTAWIAAVALALTSAAACNRDVAGTGSTRPNAENAQQAQNAGEHERPQNSGDAQRAQNPSSQGGVTSQTSFDLVDRDRDGVVSREEASTVAGLDFATADVDESTTLTRDEYVAAVDQARPRG